MTEERGKAPMEPIGLQSRLQRCKARLSELRRVVVAFSAGVDSTFLLALAVEALGPENVLAAVGVSPSLPKRELDDARRFARDLGVVLTEVITDEMGDPQYTANPAERCYFCKHHLFERLNVLAREGGGGTVVSGANADDAGDFRPGLRAGAEVGVVNPLMEAGLTKEDIRVLSRKMGLPTWDKPAMACLASRIPYGQTISAEVLGWVETAEAGLRDMGFRECRVRCHGDSARIEVPVADLGRAMSRREEIVPMVKSAGFVHVSLDMQGLRSGSMNEGLRR